MKAQERKVRRGQDMRPGQIVRRVARIRVVRDQLGIVTVETLKWTAGFVIGIPVVVAIVVTALRAMGVNVSNLLGQ